MAKITIDGKECEFDGKKMIIQVALDNGFELPHYCYHPGLSIVASCRICLAEVESPNPRNDNKVELIPKLMPTCQTPAADGMIVHTQSPKSIANQKQVMEDLLINHPLDCPVCDQAGECKLQDYSYQYGRGHSRFEETKMKQPVKDIGPNVKLYADRCIMCTRCVRFTREITESNELAVFGRGSREQIDIFPGKALDNELSANVVDLCPVGALLDKDFLFTQRVWFLSTTPSIDPLTASGDNIWVEHNEGQLYRVRPRTNSEVNGWWITDEVRYGWKFVHHEDRLNTPQLSQFGDQLSTKWDKAYDEIASGLKTAAKEGDGSVAIMVSPMLTSEEAYLLGKMARTVDPQAILAVGPIPVDGEDKTFKNGYTICAEKCPNSRGVRRALELLGGDVLSFEDLQTQLGDKASPIKAVIVTGNYPSAWATGDLVKAIGKKRFMVLIDTLPNELTPNADFILPSATWAEKSGTFENHQNRLQVFEQSIAVQEGARQEGQIALDLLHELGAAEPARFDAAKVREQMGGAFVTDVHLVQTEHTVESDMEYVAL